MYEKRYGLTRRPFPQSPDPTTFYPATTHEAALALLQRGLADGEGIVLLTGLPGTGKTVLGFVLLERLGGDVVNAFLANSRFADRTALLQAILYDLGLPYDGDTEQILRLRLIDFLLQTSALGRRTVIVVDEAHHLSPDLLEELRLLGNLEAADKAVQIVLLAQPGIAATLQAAELAAMAQRITVRARLEPLDVEEGYDYLRHHLRLAGGQPEKVIDDAALELLARGSRGLPRLLNQAAHQTLLLADAGELETADAEAALEALAQLGLVEETDEACEVRQSA